MIQPRPEAERAALVAKIEALTAEGRTREQVGAALGLTKNQVCGLVDREKRRRGGVVIKRAHHGPWTPAEDETLLRLRAQRIPVRQIAEALAPRTKNMIGNRITHLVKTGRTVLFPKPPRLAGAPDKRLVKLAVGERVEAHKPRFLPPPLPAPTFARCQYIAGEPSFDDACKCREKAKFGPYCPPHWDLTHRKHGNDGHKSQEAAA